MINQKIILGFDEVGRGPLAGPVVVAGVVTKINLTIPEKIIIRDSKTMTIKQKIKANQWIINNFNYGIGQATCQEIDKLGIVAAVKLAARKARGQLETKIQFNNLKKVLVDGQEKWFPDCQAIIKGDAKIPQIAMASIIAKVYRDNLMIQLSKKYADWDFDKHVGYGTKKHIEMIKKFGLIKKLHRVSFCQKILNR